MKDVVEYIVKSLVNHPEEVVITEKISEGMTVYEVKVNENDTGRVIGKHGRIAKAVRAVVKAAAAVNGDEKVTVDII
ncbi:MAG: KH domain-containing protein [Bacillota bacterium]